MWLPPSQAPTIPHHCLLFQKLSTVNDDMLSGGHEDGLGHLFIIECNELGWHMLILTYSWLTIREHGTHPATKQIVEATLIE